MNGNKGLVPELITLNSKNEKTERFRILLLVVPRDFLIIKKMEKIKMEELAQTLEINKRTYVRSDCRPNELPKNKWLYIEVNGYWYTEKDTYDKEA